MLPESHAALTGWLAFATLLLVVALIAPLLAMALRAQLPATRPPPRVLPPIRFGHSPRARRSPRHAVREHRRFVSGTVLAGVGLVLMGFIAALVRLDLRALLVAIAFVVPTLLVSLQSRGRDLRRGSDG